jgi:acetyl esterase/lipase
MAAMTARWIAAFVAAFLGSATAAEEFHNVSYDLSPASSAQRRLDIYTPATVPASRLPVVVYVHGGGWFRGDKSQVGHKAQWLTGLGFVLVSIDYRLAPAVRHPAASEDLALALAWAKEHIAEYGGDPARLYLLGHSSGGHLAALAATDERFLARHQLSPDWLAGVICLDTNSFALAELVPRLAPEQRQLYVEVFGAGAATWRDASPVEHATPGRRLPPFLLLVAGGGTSTHYQAGLFARRLRATGTAVTLEVFPRETHGSLNATLGDSTRPATTAVERFLDTVGAQP